MTALQRRALHEDFDRVCIPGGDSPSTACINLIERMLKANPDERASCSEIMAHPWFQMVRGVGDD